MSDGWHEFYFLVGSSAGALIGLLFVVITLTANYDPSRAETGAARLCDPDRGPLRERPVCQRRRPGPGAFPDRPRASSC